LGVLKQAAKYTSPQFTVEPSTKATLWNGQPLSKDWYHPFASPLLLPNVPLYKGHTSVMIALASLKRLPL